MANYVCAELVSNQCVTWVVSSSVLDELAITGAEAAQLAAAICSVLVIGWVLGEFGALIKKLSR